MNTYFVYISFFNAIIFSPKKSSRPVLRFDENRVRGAE